MAVLSVESDKLDEVLPGVSAGDSPELCTPNFIQEMAPPESTRTPADKYFKNFRLDIANIYNLPHVRINSSLPALESS
jgi:hypothetical protein